MKSDDATAPTALPTPDVANAATQAESSVGGTATTGDAPLRGTVDALVVVDRAHYEVLAEFGRGGLGRVLRARDRRTGRIVAIKEALRSSPSLLARFAREAIVTANLQHPAIVPVYEVGKWSTGDPFYAMKLVAGHSFAESVARARTLRDRIALLPHVIAVADALAYAHGERVIHRDLKPANVLIGDYGETVVIDWGLAKRLGDVDEPTETDDDRATGGETVAGSVLGTPGYMAPEQARGEPADARADVYAVGAMLYELLSGKRPYADATSVDELVRLAGERAPRPLGELAQEIPRELVAIVERAMAFRAADRYADARQLADDLKQFQTGGLVGAYEYTAWLRVRRWVRKHRAVVSAAAIGAAALIVVGAFSIERIRAARDRALAAQAVAEDRAAALAEEQGRQLITTGDASRALPFFAAAVAAGRHSPALEFEVGRALQQLAPVEAVIPGAGPHAEIDTLSYSPDGTQLVSAGREDVVRLWDPHSHRLLGELGEGFLAQWSPDGSYIAVVEHAGDVVLYDPRTRRELARLPFHADRTNLPVTIALSPRGDRIAIGGRAGLVTWWDPRTRRELARVTAHTAAIAALAFSPDGTRLGTCGGDRDARLWDLATGRLIATLTGHTDPVIDLAWSSDGSRVVTASSDWTAAVWDAATGKRLLALADHKAAVDSARFTGDGARVLTAAADGTIAMWDAATGAPVFAMTATSPVLEAELSPDGATIVSKSVRGEIGLWSARDGSAIGVLAGHVSSVLATAFSPDGSQLASSALDGDLRLWRLARADEATVLDVAGTTVMRGAFSPDGSRIAVTSSDPVLRLFDATTGARVAELRGHTGGIELVAFSPDSSLVASASKDGTARIWRVANGELVRTLDAQAQRVRWVGFSPDGTQLATTHDDGTARLWDAASGAPIAVLKPELGHPRFGLWSPDSSRFITPCDGSGAVLWDRTGKELAIAPLAGAELVPSAVWSNDGERFALGSSLPYIGVYDGHTGHQVARLAGHTTGAIMSLAFSPDGAHLLSGGNDGYARIWDVPDQRGAIGDGIFEVWGASYSPDGALIATVGHERAIDIWDPATGNLVGRLPTAMTGTQIWWNRDGSRCSGSAPALRSCGACRRGTAPPSNYSSACAARRAGVSPARRSSRRRRIRRRAVASTGRR
ncbi:MAG TPA: protein kinase [Kofleriaceae bacterium]